MLLLASVQTLSFALNATMAMPNLLRYVASVDKHSYFGQLTKFLSISDRKSLSTQNIKYLALDYAIGDIQALTGGRLPPIKPASDFVSAQKVSCLVLSATLRSE